MMGYGVGEARTTTHHYLFRAATFAQTFAQNHMETTGLH